MINEKNKILTVSWLSGLLSAEIFISTCEWGVQMPPLTAENSHFLQSGAQEAALVMTKKTTRTIKHENFSKMKNLEVDRWAVSYKCPRHIGNHSATILSQV